MSLSCTDAQRSDSSLTASDTDMVQQNNNGGGLPVVIPTVSVMNFQKLDDHLI